MQVMETVTEARGEPERVQHRVEEAGVAQVCQGGDAGAVTPTVRAVHPVHPASWPLGPPGLLLPRSPLTP